MSFSYGIMCFSYGKGIVFLWKMNIPYEKRNLTGRSPLARNATPSTIPGRFRGTFSLADTIPTPITMDTLALQEFGIAPLSSLSKSIVNP